MERQIASAERAALHDEEGGVVPELRAYCRALGADFELVDLQWGVPEEVDGQEVRAETSSVRHQSTAPGKRVGLTFMDRDIA
jgi:hypothetical protein